VSWLSELFGGSKRSYDYGGEKPYGSITEFALGKDLTDTLRKRMRGQDVGIDPSYVSRRTSPVVAQREARWGQYEAPALTEHAASRGITDSPLSMDIMSRRRGDMERDINQYLGETSWQAELLKRKEIADAIAQSYPVSALEAGTRAGRANFERGVWDRQIAGKQADLNRGMQGINFLTRIPLTAANVYSAASGYDSTKALTDALLNRTRTPAEEDYYGGTPRRTMYDVPNLFNPDNFYEYYDKYKAGR